MRGEADMSSMAERLFGDSQGDWVSDFVHRQPQSPPEPSTRRGQRAPMMAMGARVFGDAQGDWVHDYVKSMPLFPESHRSR